MFPWLLNAFRAAAPGIASYFIASEAGNALLDKVIPDSVKDKVTDEKGGYAWWFIILLFILIGGVIAFVVSLLLKAFGKGKKGFKLFGLALGGVACYALDNYLGLGNDPNVMYGAALCTLTTGAGVVTNATLNFMPERIYYAAATQLTGIKISTRDNGTIFDSDANGLTHMGLVRVFGQVTNGYSIILANDLIESGSVFFTFTNSAAQTPIIQYDSDMGVNEGEERFMQGGQVQVLVGGNKFSNFKFLHLPSLAATDLITIQYADGRVQSNQTRVDLQYKLGLTQSVVNTPVYTIDNLAGDIVSVNVNVGTQQTGYIQRWAPTVGMVNPNMN